MGFGVVAKSAMRGSLGILAPFSTVEMIPPDLSWASVSGQWNATWVEWGRGIMAWRAEEGGVHRKGWGGWHARFLMSHARHTPL